MKLVEPNETSKLVTPGNAPKLYTANKVIAILKLQDVYTRESLINLAIKGKLKYYKPRGNLRTSYLFALEDVRAFCQLEVVEAR